MLRPLTKLELDISSAGGCQLPGCDHKNHGGDGRMYLNPNCCRRAGTDVSYAPGSGILRIECSKCGKLMVEIAVAESR